MSQGRTSEAEELARHKVFLELTDEDANLLAELGRRLALEDREAFLERFFDHFQRFPETSSVLASEQEAERLREHLANYFRQLTGGDYGERYAGNRREVGHVHQRRGLDAKWYLGAYGKYLRELVPAVFALYEREPARRVAVLQALHKVLFLDMSLVLEAYIQADQQALRNRETRLRHVHRLAAIGSWEWHAAVRSIHLSDDAARLFGLPPGSDVLHASRVMDLVHEDDRAGFLAAAERAISEGLPFQLVHRVRLPNDELRYLKHYAEPVRGAHGVQPVMGAVQDISDQYRTQRQLDWMTRHDPLTGLANMSSALGALEHQLLEAERHRGELSVLLIGLDRLRRINDGLGRDIGDRLLRLCAKRLQRAFPAHLVARVSGDEFLLVPLGQMTTELESLVERAMALFHLPVQIAGHEMPVSASVGALRMRGREMAARDVIRGATSAMYRAKGAGGRTWRLFDSARDVERAGALGLEAQLRRALETGEFRLHYQPQFTVADGRLCGLEALLRWESSQGLQSPSVFLAVLEETGLIGEGGRTVIRQACEQVAAWVREGFAPPRVAVNVSPLQLADPEFVTVVSDALARAAIPPGTLELELTEHAVIQSPEQAQKHLEACKALGVSIAMDDFGTGYSSLSYLKRLPLDSGKMDKSFGEDLPGDTGNVALTRAVIAMAHGLGLRVVAEGVENTGQMDFLQAQQCDVVQGFLLGKPMPPEQVRRLFTAPQALP
ncbi:MAG: EAL domain-containing protein [Ectothiorhodospiraceae bacterium]|nr:EAL domain-containing protein [Ectothiorhodospiraceae bacterium]